MLEEDPVAVAAADVVVVVVVGMMGIVVEAVGAT
jgi:hypothetical protein